MELVKGKQQILNTLYSLFDKEKVNRILLHGILDKDLIKMICNRINHLDDKIEFKTIISNLHDKKSFGVARQYLNESQIKASIKCRSKYIIVNEHLLFLSGSWTDTSHDIGDNDLIILFNSYTQSLNELENIFINDWNNGVKLHL